MRPHPVAVLASLGLVVFLAGALRWMVMSDPEAEWVSPVGTVAAWALFVPAALAARRIPARHGATVVLLGSVMLGVAAMSAPPATSNDSARYAWDGIVQKAGISPYRYVPADEALRTLRPQWLFQDPDPDGTCHTNPFPTGTETTTNLPGGTTLCTAINRPAVPTVYPAAGELYFLTVRLAADAEVPFIAFQLAGLLLSLAVTALLLIFLHRTGRHAHQAVWWGWSPLVAIDGINGAHVDTLGAALTLAAALLLVSGHSRWSGVAFGAAVATKLIPAISAPALLYRRPIGFVATAAATFVVTYIPYVIASGWTVLGYLPEYLRSEGYDGQNSPRFTLLSFLLPASWAAPTALLLLLGLAVYDWRTTDTARPWDGQVFMVGATLLLVSPGYPWYALLLLPFVVLSRRYEFAVIAPVLALMYFTGAEPYGQQAAQIGLSTAALLIAAATIVRKRRSTP
ncbi:glycosyltransferase 87 family protein [Arthrobacter sp. MMS24-T111]